jgi:biopolymer transport protein ExbD/biopolymer transport protein TolR
MVVAITRDGGIFLGKDRIQPDQLTNKVKDRIATRQDKRVYVRSDARAKYKSVVEVVDNVRAAGVDDLGLLTDQRRQTNTPPPAPTPGGSE